MCVRVCVRACVHVCVCALAAFSRARAVTYLHLQYYTMVGLKWGSLTAKVQYMANVSNWPGYIVLKYFESIPIPIPIDMLILEPELGYQNIGG